MPTANATVTGKTGPADQMTAIAVNNISQMVFEPNAQMIRFKKQDGTFTEMDMNGVTTFTVTITGGNFAITLS